MGVSRVFAGTEEFKPQYHVVTPVHNRSGWCRWRVHVDREVLASTHPFCTTTFTSTTGFPLVLCSIPLIVEVERKIRFRGLERVYGGTDEWRSVTRVPTSRGVSGPVVVTQKVGPVFQKVGHGGSSFPKLGPCFLGRGGSGELTRGWTCVILFSNLLPETRRHQPIRSLKRGTGGIPDGVGRVRIFEYGLSTSVPQPH